MNGFSPGVPLYTAEQQEDIIRQSFGISPDVQETIVPQVPQEELVQISKAELESLKSKQQPVVEKQEEVKPNEDYASFLDQLLMIEPVVAEKEEVPVTEEKKEVPEKDNQLRRLQEESKTYYVSIGQEAEKMGMSGREAIDMVLAMTPIELAEVAFIKKQISLGKTTDDIFGKKQPLPQMKTIATESPAIITNRYQQDTETYEKNGFI